MTEAYEVNKLIFFETVKLLKRRKTVTKKEIQSHLTQYLEGNQRYRLTRILARMLRDKLVEIVGSRYRGHYRLIGNLDEDRAWPKVWEGLKEYDRSRKSGRDNEVSLTFSPPPIPHKVNHDIISIALKAHQNAKESLSRLDKIQLVEEIVKLRGVAETQAEQLRNVRTELGSLNDDYEIILRERDRLLQENTSLHHKLNGREKNEPVS